MSEQNNKLKILFVSRAYPPIVGGIENQNYELSVWLQKYAEVKTIANIRGKKFLPIFLPYALGRSLWEMSRHDVLLLGDGVLGIVGFFTKLLWRKPTISVVHGLDLTYPSKIYQKLWVSFFLKKMDKLIAVGNETILAGTSRGIDEDKFHFIPNGIDTDKFFHEYDRKELEKILMDTLEHKKVILTSGRLAKRKGVAWFIRNVMPKLPENAIYVVAGDGPDRNNIKDAIQETGLKSRVHTLGYVTDKVRDVLFNTCDVFVQPNIKVEGDMEGFGISVIEAGSCRLPVVASRLEGLKDAIIDGQNGILVDPNDAEGYAREITSLIENAEKRRQLGENARQIGRAHV